MRLGCNHAKFCENQSTGSEVKGDTQREPAEPTRMLYNITSCEDLYKTDTKACQLHHKPSSTIFTPCEKF